MKERLRLLKNLYVKKTFMVALTLVASFVFATSSANAQCNRPILCSVGPCVSVDWIVDGTFSAFVECQSLG